MPNRLQQLFTTRPENLLSVYFTAGYPALDDTLVLAKKLEDAGADFLEIGFPFSDPLSDGPVIQHSSHEALKNSMNLTYLFGQLAALRPAIKIPVILMGYFNPVLQYGIERFCADAEKAGVDGVIIPDLPMVEFEQFYSKVFEKHNLSNIFLVTPQTAETRIRKIDTLSNAFIYLLSSSSITGSSLQIDTVSETYFKRLQAMNLHNPLMIGFGISSHKSFKEACTYTAGAIIGSAFIRALDEGKDVATWVKSIREEPVTA